MIDIQIAGEAISPRGLSRQGAARKVIPFQSDLRGDVAAERGAAVRIAVGAPS